MNQPDPFKKYKEYYKEIIHFQNIASLLQWDLEVMLPSQAREERSEQISLLSTHVHKLMTDDRFGDLIENAKESVKDQLPQNWKLQREFEVLHKDRKRALKIPQDLIAQFSKLTSMGVGIWANARKNKNFKEFENILIEIVSLSKKIADCLEYKTERYDALLDEYESNTKAKDLQVLFNDLKASLIPIIQKSKTYLNPFKTKTPIDVQTIFNKNLPAMLGLRSDLHRLDASTHPFSTGMGRLDKRITTRYDINDPLSSIFSVLHETGHALYEMGIGEIEDYPSPLASHISLGVHESQSRLWENQIGRSLPFWEYFYPIFLKDMKLKSSDISLDQIYNYANSVQKSKIRVESDQVTYNLHIILRFEIERELVNDQIQVSDLPELWNQKMNEYLGQKIENDAEGVLQDIHWSIGSFGYFPTYTLGNIYAAQLFHTFIQSHSNFWTELKSTGNMSSLLNWLKQNIHLHGKLYEPIELIEKATSEKPNAKYLIQHLTQII